jgi:hypothetical protein
MAESNSKGKDSLALGQVTGPEDIIERTVAHELAGSMFENYYR